MTSPSIAATIPDQLKGRGLRFTRLERKNRKASGWSW